MQIESDESDKSIKLDKSTKQRKPKMSYTQIKTYLSKLIINQFNIYYIDDKKPKQITNIPEIKNWGTINQLFVEKDGAIIFNKNLHILQKENNIHIKIYQTGSTTYASPIDNILDENNSFEYRMDILVDKNVVYSMRIDSSSFYTNDLKEIKSEMFKTFSYISDKCTFVILYLLS
jgi:hypothetical protein